MTASEGITRTSVSGALTSRLGRRFVALFGLCALLPLVVFAALASSRVSDQMRSDLRLSLHGAAKTAGMGIAARLSQVAGDLALASELVRSWQIEGAWSDGSALQRQVGDRCAGMWVLDGGRSETLLGPLAAPELPLDDDRRAHLANGKPVVQIVGELGELYMTLAIDPDDASGARVIALIRRDWFWDPDELRGVGCEFACYDRLGVAVYHTFDRLPDAGELATAASHKQASGSLEWQVDGEPHVARFWHAFLRPQYLFDVWVVQSRPEADAFAVGDAFTRWFWLTAACTLLCVLLASLVQMRRTLGPIVSLRAATGRRGSGELDVRVRIESADEFGELGVAFNEMAERLQENIRRREQTERELVASRDAALAAVKAKAEFVTNVSHEFRTPMAEILGATEILSTIEDDDDGSVREEFSGIALHGAKRLAQLVDDVLELGEPTADAVEPVTLAENLQAAVDEFAPAERVRVVMQLEPDLPNVLGDPQRLRQTWSRLLDNALKFSADDQKVEVRGGRDGAFVVVDFVDRGVGIDRDDIGKVFEPFAQVGRDQMIDKANGTGLGLTLAKSVVETHGGTITVRSRPGEGSTFRVSLPAEVAAARG